MDIAQLLNQSEGKTLEFKQDLSSSMGIIRTMIAFANTAGGTIVVGVVDSTKAIVGIPDPLSAEEKIANWINDLIAPQLLPDLEIIPWRNLYLLAIQIYPSATRPHYLKKLGIEQGTYIRVGSTNRLADKSMLSEIQRVRIEDSFDKQAMPELDSEAIDFRVVSELFAPLRKLNKNDLESMDLITTYQQRKVPTIGGIILFGVNRSKYFPDAWIQVGRFNGCNKTHITDTQEITTYPILAIDAVMEFIKKHVMHGIKITGVKHTDTWSLPLTAIRETIINAVVHADYAQKGAPIRLAIFDDRIEIENPGLLLFGLTIDDIKRGVSKLRNRVIGQLFYRLGLIERWGSGIKRIVDSCLESGFPEPIFEEIGTHFRVTIFTIVSSRKILNETEQAIIDMLKKHNGLSTNEIATLIHKSSRTTRTRLISLIAKGLVSELGQGVNDPGKKYFYNS